MVPWHSSRMLLSYRVQGSYKILCILYGQAEAFPLQSLLWSKLTPTQSMRRAELKASGVTPLQKSLSKFRNGADWADNFPTFHHRWGDFDDPNGSIMLKSWFRRFRTSPIIRADPFVSRIRDACAMPRDLNMIVDKALQSQQCWLYLRRHLSRRMWHS